MLCYKFIQFSEQLANSYLWWDASLYYNQVTMADIDLDQTNFKEQGAVNKKKYGNLTILSNKCVHVSVGPNYRQFLFGFSLLVIVSVAIAIFVVYKIDNPTHKYISIALCIMAPLLYLMAALSDPGIYHPDECFELKPRFCHFCAHFMPGSVKHCHRCNICIYGYDHHCPWMSKCIGKNNIGFFYAFMVVLTSLNAIMYYSFYVGFWGGP